MSHPSRSRSLFPCSRALGRARGTRVPRPQLIGTPSPRPGRPLCLRKERDSGGHLEMGAGAQYDVFDFRPDHARSDFRGPASWRSGESTLLFARFAAGLFLLFGAPPRPPTSPRVRRSCGFKTDTTADHETATLLSLDVGAVGNRQSHHVLEACAWRNRQSTKPPQEFSPALRSRRCGAVGGNHLSVAAPQPRIGSFPPGYEGVRQLSAHLILPFSLLPLFRRPDLSDLCLHSSDLP